jgi:hypothetical protein
MRKLLAGLVLLLLVSACNREQRTTLPFENNPGVLKGTWSGTIANYPTTDNTTRVLLQDLQPICKTTNDSGYCATYTFTGTIRLGEGTPVPITGEGQVPGSLYYSVLHPQLTPPPAPRAQAALVKMLFSLASRLTIGITNTRAQLRLVVKPPMTLF